MCVLVCVYGLCLACVVLWGKLCGFYGVKSGVRLSIKGKSVFYVVKLSGKVGW